jgi:phosphatidylglycerol lysyltransferase
MSTRVEVAPIQSRPTRTAPASAAERPRAVNVTLVARRLRDSLPAVIALVLFLAALEVLRFELRSLSLVQLREDLLSIPAGHVALAIALTALNYTVLTGYDLVAFLYLGKRLARGRVMLTSFLAYAISNNVGLAMLSGASVRYRFYTRWGVTAQDLSRIVFSYSVTFWLGLFALGGLSLLTTPLPQIAGLPAGRLVIAAGVVLLLAPPAYIIATVMRRAPLRVWRLELPLPRPSIAVAQLVLSILDWAMVGGVLYVLLPPSALPFLGFMAIFLVSILLGMASHVPGGLGVFEGLMVLLLAPYLTSSQVLPALVAFRAIYYLLPLAIALLMIVVDELLLRRAHVARIGTAAARISEQLTPRLLAAATFLAGAVLLFSGAMPALTGRLALLDRVVPLSLIETSHFAASLIGVALLVLSQGLARRLDAAYFLAVWLLGAGIAASLLKGFDYEEALLLAAVLAMLYAARAAFDRRASFFETRFSPMWIACVIGVICASVWLGVFAYAKVQYSDQLWWQFELHGDASRFLRASVGGGLLLLVVALTRLIGYAPHVTTPPSDAELEDVERIVRRQSATFPNLAFLRDKALIFDDDRSAFLMYGVQGRTWVALGDPVGRPDSVTSVIRRFLERADDFGGVPVFYEVTPVHLHQYADFGLTFVRLGEEARVSLRAFTLEGRSAAKLRHAVRRIEREDGRFRIAAPPHSDALLRELREVSDEWLADKSAGEKGFSLGYFDEAYLRRYPIALIERGGRIDAFANIWSGGDRVELSLDLMRHRARVPNSTMEALFVHLLQWGKEQGYQWFNLGMAPHSSTGMPTHSTDSAGYGPTRTSSIQSGSRAIWRIPAAFAWPES